MSDPRGAGRPDEEGASTAPIPEPSDESDERREPGTSASKESDWERRRRLAAVFGDVLPETTTDERDPGDDDTSEDWLRRQVPPHHG